MDFFRKVFILLQITTGYVWTVSIYGNGLNKYKKFVTAR